MAGAQAGNALGLWGLQPLLRGQESLWCFPKLVTIFHVFFSNYSGLTQPLSFFNPWTAGEFQG